MVTRRRLRLLARYLSGECKGPEKRRVEEWIQSSIRNKKSFEGLAAIWEIAARDKEEWKSRRAITALRLKLKDVGPPPGVSRRGQFRVVNIRPVRARHYDLSWKSAAGVLGVSMAIILGVYAAAFFKDKALEEKKAPIATATNVYEQVSTKPGEQATLTLSGGIRIVLNSASRLRYTYGVKGGRQFQLVGEAYFRVAPHHDGPIEVLTRTAVIRDIGTKFDVKAWPDDYRTQVAVKQGTVIVHPRDTIRGSAAMVASGQVTAVGSEGFILSPRYTDINAILSWTKGKLVFHNDPLSEVVKQLRRRYGISCLLADTSLGARTLTATFGRHESTKEVLDIIALSLRLRYKTSKDSVLFVATKANSM